MRALFLVADGAAGGFGAGVMGIVFSGVAGSAGAAAARGAVPGEVYARNCVSTALITNAVRRMARNTVALGVRSILRAMAHSPLSFEVKRKSGPVARVTPCEGGKFSVLRAQPSSRAMRSRSRNCDDVATAAILSCVRNGCGPNVLAGHGVRKKISFPTKPVLAGFALRPGRDRAAAQAIGIAQPLAQGLSSRLTLFSRARVGRKIGP